MSPEREHAAEGANDAPSPPAPSPAARLAAAIIDVAAEATEPEATAEGPRATVLVVAAEDDLRRYVRECLRERTDLRVLEAATVGAAAALAAADAPRLLIVDEPEHRVLAALPRTRAILIVDDVRPGGGPRAWVRLLARPFSAQGLLAEVGRSLGD